MALSNATVQLIIFMLVFASIANTSGLTNIIANALMTSSISKGRPWVLSLMLLLASYFATAFVDTVPAILICWGFVYTICEEVGYKPYEKWPAYMIAGITFASCLGFIMFPFKVAVVANMGFLAAAAGMPAIDFSYVAYILLALILSATCLFIYILIGKYIIRPDLSRLASINLTNRDKKSMNEKQIIAAGLLIALIVFMLLANFLPEGNGLKNILGSFGTIGIALFFIGIACFIPYGEGKYTTFKELANNGLAWDLVFMISAALTLAGGLTSEEAGIKEFLMQTLSPILNGSTALGFMIVTLIVTAILTNLVNNVVVSAIVIPIMYPFSVSLGFDPVAFTVLFIFVDTIAMLLPASSPAGALMHGNRDWITGTQAIAYGTLCMIIMIVVACTVGIPLANIIL